MNLFNSAKALNEANEKVSALEASMEAAVLENSQLAASVASLTEKLAAAESANAETAAKLADVEGKVDAAEQKATEASAKLAEEIASRSTAPVPVAPDAGEADPLAALHAASPSDRLALYRKLSASGSISAAFNKTK